MSRPLRIEYPGAVYHVTARGNRRSNIFTDEEDNSVFLAILAETVKRFHVLCHGHCLMGNHYHLMLETIEGNLCRAMRHLNGAYTQTYNRKHRKCGHVFQGRYKAILIQKSSHLLEVCRYVVLNPVRAGIVDAPAEWPWSSYRSTAGMEMEPEHLTTGWVLSQFGEDVGTARVRYVEFVNDGSSRKALGEVASGIVLGGSDFVSQSMLLAHGEGDITEIPREQRYVGRPKLSELMCGAGGRFEKWLRAVEYGYTQKEVAKQCNVHYSYVSRMLKLERSKVKT